MQEIAAVVAFLVSPAAVFVNGAAIPVDGGWLTGQMEVSGVTAGLLEVVGVDLGKQAPVVA